jgi:hypothetical protein
MLFHGYCLDKSCDISFDIIKVCCVVTDLSAFINSSSDSDIVVRDYDGRQFVVKKNDVVWDNGGITQ